MGLGSLSGEGKSEGEEAEEGRNRGGSDRAAAAGFRAG